METESQEFQTAWPGVNFHLWMLDLHDKAGRKSPKILAILPTKEGGASHVICIRRTKNKVRVAKQSENEWASAFDSTIDISPPSPPKNEALKMKTHIVW